MPVMFRMIESFEVVGLPLFFNFDFSKLKLDCHVASVALLVLCSNCLS